MRAGIVAAAVINFSMCHPDEKVSMMDFVPGEKKADGSLSGLTPEQQAAKIIEAFGKKTYTR